MNKNSRIYVAGHKGLVGSAILRRLELEGYTHLITRRHRELDLMRQTEVEDFFERVRPEYVFLAAAKVGGILANSTFPADFIYDNIMIQSNVMRSAHRSGVKKLLFLGSSCIYPRECPQPMKEEYLLSGKLEATNEPYAVAKIAGIKMCQAYNRQYGTNFVSVMPTNLYGPGDNFDLETSHVLAALIRKFHEAKLHRAKLVEVGGPNDSASYVERSDFQTSNRKAQRNPPPAASEDFVTVWGTGSPRREFLHVDDLSDACLFIMNHNAEDDIVNVGVGRDISIRDLAELVQGVVGYQGAIQYDPSKPDGTPRKLLDVSRMKSLGWESKMDLRRGIEETYQWYVRNRSDEGRGTIDE